MNNQAAIVNLASFPTAGIGASLGGQPEGTDTAFLKPWRDTLNLSPLPRECLGYLHSTFSARQGFSSSNRTSGSLFLSNRSIMARML